MIENFSGIRSAMERQDVPDEVPIADAVEQDRPAVRPPIDEDRDDENSVSDPGGLPLEASDGDWQEQREAVEFDPDDEIADNES
ncbi:hypothetical protein KL858_03520 [Mycolicibacterium goodii]|nr:hypothetical protein [Mycolicibacterium goodii]